MIRRVTTTCAVLLDLYVFRRSVARGKYAQMRDGGEKLAGIAPAPYGAQRYADSRNSISVDQYSTPGTTNREGYEVPQEQFEYDTSYRGGHQPDAPRS